MVSIAIPTPYRRPPTLTANGTVVVVAVAAAAVADAVDVDPIIPKVNGSDAATCHTNVMNQKETAPLVVFNNSSRRLSFPIFVAR